MKKIKITKKEKLAIEEIVVVLGVIILIFLAINFYSRLSLISPVNGEKTIDRTPEFSWSGKCNEYILLVDDSNNFDSPILEISLKGNTYIPEKEFGFGDYYWKIKAFDGEKWVESKIESFKVESFIALKLENEEVRNIGNTPAKVDVLKKDESGWSIVGAAVLSVNEILVYEEGDGLYKAEQNE